MNNILNSFRCIAVFMVVIGHQAVIVFFVLSGYLAGEGMLKRYILNSIDTNYIKVYFIKRFSRIYVVLVSVLIVGYVLDYYGSELFQELYNNTCHISSMNQNILEKLCITIFAGNILNLQTIFVEPLGSNGPLRSLANEW